MHLRRGGRAASTLGGAGLEAVGELAGDVLERPHAAGAGGLSALGLLAPVVCGGSVAVPVHNAGAAEDESFEDRP